VLDDSGIVNLCAWRESGKQSTTQAMKGSAIGLLRIGNLIDLAVTLHTTCSACKEKDSTYRDVIHIVVLKGRTLGLGWERV
jgi:hypothetical protein